MIYPDGHYRYRVVLIEDGTETILDSFHGRTAAEYDLNEASNEGMSVKLVDWLEQQEHAA